MLSAATDAVTVRRALRAGALGYLVKPFERRALVDVLDRYARFRNVLDEERSVSQDEIDRALGILHAGGDTSSVSRSATERVILGALVASRSTRRYQRMVSATASHRTPPQSGLRRVVSASMPGTIVEWYEFFLYATAATLVFNLIMFPPSDDPYAGIIAAFVT